MTVGLRQVAEHAGVSVSTASRALAGSTRISDATRRRVGEVAESLGYRPNANARALRTSRSQLVGLVVTNLVNASLHVIAAVVQQQLADAGMQMMLSVTGGDAAHERAALRTLIDHNALGVIVVGSDLRANDELLQAGLPVVHLARRPKTPIGDCVLGDELAGGRQATEYLLGMGHRRIAIISGPQEVTSGAERLSGYRLAMGERRIAVREELLMTGPFLADTGSEAVRALMALPLRRRPSALVVANHEAAFGALPALSELGVAVPSQLSLVCIEDAELMRWWHPAVTVVDNSAAKMGELASHLLLQRVRDHDSNSPRRFEEFRVGTHLVERASCGPLRQQR